MQISLKKWSFLYEPYVLGVVCVGYILGELGHYLIGVTSKAVAMDLHYGDVSCQLNGTTFERTGVKMDCRSANSSDSCEELNANISFSCEWTYNGLGLDYQILAGPSFIAVFTIVGVAMGFLADKYNRVRILAGCTVVFGLAIVLCGSVKEYWQLVVLRMIMAAGESGCNPLATGILSDIFPEKQRALVMSLFNWGIYGGYGLAFPVGRYVPSLNLFDLGWRVTYYIPGVITVLVAILTALTLKEPKRTQIGEDLSRNKEKISVVKVIFEPRVAMLAIAASIRHCGGMCFAYNCDLYYETYFPDYDLGWWLFAVTIVVGGVGIVVGGVVSDKIVAKMGVRSRAAVLSISQLISTPFAFGSVFFDPQWAMTTLGISYFFAEMWFGILFAILVEIVPLQVRSSTLGLFLFVMNNVGGNLPILVDPVAKRIGYRESLYIFYAGAYGISSILFFITLFFMEGPKKDANPPRNVTSYDNNVFSIKDETKMEDFSSQNDKNRQNRLEMNQI